MRSSVIVQLTPAWLGKTPVLFDVVYRHVCCWARCCLARDVYVSSAATCTGTSVYTVCVLLLQTMGFGRDVTGRAAGAAPGSSSSNTTPGPPRGSAAGPLGGAIIGPLGGVAWGTVLYPAPPSLSPRPGQAALHPRPAAALYKAPGCSGGRGQACVEGGRHEHRWAARSVAGLPALRTYEAPASTRRLAPRLAPRPPQGVYLHSCSPPGRGCCCPPPTHTRHASPGGLITNKRVRVWCSMHDDRTTHSRYVC